MKKIDNKQPTFRFATLRERVFVWPAEYELQVCFRPCEGLFFRHVVDS